MAAYDDLEGLLRAVHVPSLSEWARRARVSEHAVRHARSLGRPLTRANAEKLAAAGGVDVTVVDLAMTLPATFGRPATKGRR